MTDEEKSGIDKAIGKANLSHEIGGATEVSGKPQPNDPTPLDKARELGQDLHNKGLILDK